MCHQKSVGIGLGHSSLVSLASVIVDYWVFDKVADKNVITHSFLPISLFFLGESVSADMFFGAGVEDAFSFVFPVRSEPVVMFTFVEVSMDVFTVS